MYDVGNPKDRGARRGDQSLANLRLAISAIARIPAAQDWLARAALAKSLLAKGLAPGELLRSLDLDNVAIGDFIKFDEDEPRVPARTGRDGGRWTRAGSSSSSIASAVVALASRGAPLLAPSLGAETLAALSTFAASVGFVAALGMLFVPSPNSTSTSGPLPGDTENTYSYDHDEGLLRILGPSGVVLAAGHKDGTGVFYDANTGVPFAREVDGALLFNGASVTQTAPTTAARVKDGEDEDEEDPKLCPDPGLDQPGADSASRRAKAYQMQISFMINPQRPLPFGLAMNLINPLTGKLVHYDECDEQTGTMIEAKGPGFVGLMSFPAGRASVDKQFLDQGAENWRQQEAAT